MTVTIELPIPDQYVPVLTEIYTDMPGIKNELYNFLKQKIIHYLYNQYKDTAQTNMNADVQAELDRLTELYNID